MLTVGAVTALVIAVVTALLVADKPTEEARIEQAIADAGYCDETADCELLYAPCPFGCWAAVNKAESERIQSMMDGYESTCIYSCIESSGVDCVSGKCVARETALPE